MWGMHELGGTSPTAAGRGGMWYGQTVTNPVQLGQQLMDREQQLRLQQRQQDFAAGESARGRAFQAGERAAGQAFAGEEAQRGRAFQAGERAAGQAFTGEQAELGRQFQGTQAERDREQRQREADLSYRASIFPASQQMERFSQVFPFLKQ